MGLFRKTMSISSGGLVNYKNNREKVADAAARTSKANKKVAKAEADLLREQARQAKRGR